MSLPSNTMVPLLAGRVPASTARNVDLPAPLGPIRPVICPWGTSIETPSTACMPSKWRWMSSATSIGWSGRPDKLHLHGVWAAGEDSARLRSHAFGPEPEEADDQQTDRHPLQRGEQPGRPEVEIVRVEDASHLLEAHRDEQGAEDGADVVASPSDDDRREQDDRLRVQPNRRRPELDETDQDGA